MGNSLPKFHKEYPPSREVTTKYGPIVGRRLVHEGEKQVDAFQGIPYAKPPVGELRFKKPEPPEPWTTVKECKAFGARGIQKDRNPLEKFSHPQSEDNLFLNVFSPVWENKSKFPVLVFIHGGAFCIDSTVKYGDIGISKHLVTKDVVVVTLQYRLGHLGFWTTGDDVCPGNLAFWDMTLALKWIQENIEAFNGDPENVTVMGQSAGGCAVDLLTLSPHSRDLFHKVIPMAGNSSCGWIQENSVDCSTKFAQQLGIPHCCDSTKMLEELRKVPAPQFALGMDTSGLMGSTAYSIFPRIDGHFFPKPIEELRKEAPGKPKMIGCCRSEGLLMVGTGCFNTPYTIEEVAARIYPESEFPQNFLELRRRFYNLTLGLDKQYTPEELARACGEAYGDFFLNNGCQQAVIDHLNHWSEPVYFYSFDFYNPKMFGPLFKKAPYLDATHCTENQYIFNINAYFDFQWTEDDYKVLELTTTLWTNFAKFGNPNGPDEKSPLPERWEPASMERPQEHLQLNLTPTIGHLYRNGRPMMLIEARREAKEHQDKKKEPVPTEGTAIIATNNA